MRRLPTAWLRWIARWGFGRLRFSAESELLARDLERIAEEYGGYTCPMVSGWQ